MVLRLSCSVANCAHGSIDSSRGRVLLYRLLECMCNYVPQYFMIAESRWVRAPSAICYRRVATCIFKLQLARYPFYKPSCCSTNLPVVLQTFLLFYKPSCWMGYCVSADLLSTTVPYSEVDLNGLTISVCVRPTSGLPSSCRGRHWQPDARPDCSMVSLTFLRLGGLCWAGHLERQPNEDHERLPPDCDQLLLLGGTTSWNSKEFLHPLP